MANRKNEESNCHPEALAVNTSPVCPMSCLSMGLLRGGGGGMETEDPVLNKAYRLLVNMTQVDTAARKHKVWHTDVLPPAPLKWVQL